MAVVGGQAFVGLVFENGRPFFMNDCIFYKRVSVKRSPAPFMPSMR